MAINTPKEQHSDASLVKKKRQLSLFYFAHTITEEINLDTKSFMTLYRITTNSFAFARTYTYQKEDLSDWPQNLNISYYSITSINGEVGNRGPKRFRNDFAHTK